MSTRQRLVSVTPSAARLTHSLRDIGYDFQSAVADLVDNSISAGAGKVDVSIEFDGLDSRVLISDDGSGISPNGLLEALRFGSRRTYQQDDLGRYGLGLKTASLSQCRSVTVASRWSAENDRVALRLLDLDIIAEHDQWLVAVPQENDTTRRARAWLREGTGTVVIWENLDRVLPDNRPEGGWARRRMATYARHTSDHLAMVFHRFIEGLPDGRRVAISVNDEKLQAWNPFAPEEPDTEILPEHRLELTVGDSTGTIGLKRYLLPARDRFSSPAEFERMSGPQKWNRQQGLYIYRADRLVQWGGWGGIRAIDEHTKLGRAALDYSTDLDRAFNINVAKMRVTLPTQLRQMLERPVNELCMAADRAYRRTEGRPMRPHDVRGSGGDLFETGMALKAAAMQVGETAALQRIAEALGAHTPDLVEALGLRGKR